MTVFVITSAYDYEGESPVGVASSLEVAKQIAENESATRGFEPTAWKEAGGHFELEYGATQFVIREENVLDEATASVK